MSERNFTLNMIFSKSSTADIVEKIFQELSVSFEKTSLDLAAERVAAQLMALNNESSLQFSRMYKEFGDYFYVNSLSRRNEKISIGCLLGSGSNDFICGYLEILNRLECAELFASEECIDWESDDGDGFERLVYRLKDGIIKQTTEVVPFDD